MPEPMAAPRRAGSISGEPASAHASRAAMRAYWLDGSRRRVSTLASTSPGFVAIVAAKVTGSSCLATQSKSIVRAPDRPASRASHVSVAVPPRGVVAPRPVTTMRRSRLDVMVTCSSESSGVGWCEGCWVCRGCCGAAWVARAAGAARSAPGGAGRRPGASGLRAGDEGDGVADGLEVLDLAVRDAHAELLLGVDDDRHHREGVDVEVLGEGLVHLDGRGVESGLLVDDLGKTLEDLLLGLCHLSTPWCVVPGGCRSVARMTRRDPRECWTARAGSAQGSTTTCAAYTRPAPKPIWSARPPLGISFSASIRVVAIGIEAAEVLAVVTMSRATGMSAGSLSCLTIASMMRMFAWCGMKASRSSALMPALSMACWATGAMPQTAQRKTVWPAMPIAGHTFLSACADCHDSRTSVQACFWLMASRCVPSEPQTVGPMPGVSLGPMTQAPAPSPKMKALPRS